LPDHNTRAGRRRGTRIGDQFSMRTREMLEHPSWRVLSRAAHLVIDRISLEVRYHGGVGVRGVPVTYRDFEKYGVDPQSTAAAIREAVALGFVEIIRQGRAGNAEYRKPTLYRLTFELMAGDYRPSNDWKRIVRTRRAMSPDGDNHEAELGSSEDKHALRQARAIAVQARADSRSSRNRNPRRVSTLRSAGDIPSETRQAPGGRNPRTSITRETPRTIDSLGRAATRGPGRDQSHPRHSSSPSPRSADRGQRADEYRSVDQSRPRIRPRTSA